jgi:hypothetical protein
MTGTMRNEYKEKRISIISRSYEKGSDQQIIMVYRFRGQHETGLVFCLDVLMNNEAVPSKCIASEDMFFIRKMFINYLIDLSNDGWKRQGANSPDFERSEFFEPAQL